MVIMIQISLLITITYILWIFLRPVITEKNKREVGIKRASMIYSDEKGTKMLYGEKLGLQGKPDMVFETWLLRKIIPLEIKSGRLTEEMPHLGDIYQVVAYFLIIEEAWGKRPPYGQLVYSNKTFKIRNTRKLRKAVKQTINEMRAMLAEEYHPSPATDFMKCKHCLCRETVCEWNQER